MRAGSCRGRHSGRDRRRRVKHRGVFAVHEAGILEGQCRIGVAVHLGLGVGRYGQDRLGDGGGNHLCADRIPRGVCTLERQPVNHHALLLSGLRGVEKGDRRCCHQRNLRVPRHQARKHPVGGHRRVREAVVRLVRNRKLGQRQQHRHRQRIRLRAHGRRIGHAVELILDYSADPVGALRALGHLDHILEDDGIVGLQILAKEYQRAVRRLVNRLAVAGCRDNRPAVGQLGAPQERQHLAPFGGISERALDRHGLSGHIACDRMRGARGVERDHKGFAVRLIVGHGSVVGHRHRHAERRECRAGLRGRGRPRKHPARGIDLHAGVFGRLIEREGQGVGFRVGRGRREGQRREDIGALIPDRRQHRRVIDRVDRHVHGHGVETAQAV